MTTSSALGGLKKEILDSIVTSNVPAEDVLKRLESYGIEWYLTEAGDLMIRYWQVGAEGFVLPEHVARIQQDRTVPREANVLEWLSRNLPELRRHYSGNWIAVINNQVIAAAPNLPGLLAQVGTSGKDRPFITEIPAEPVIWTTAYAEQSV